jgi:gliding motility-associated-like protein
LSSSGNKIVDLHRYRSKQVAITLRKLFAFLPILPWLTCPAFAQPSSCGPGQPHLIKSTVLTYLKLSHSLYDYHYRFLYTYTVECGNTHTANPLYIYDPQKSIYAAPAWQLDSSKNIIGVPDPCLGFQSPPCYSVYYYHIDTLLPLNQFGYVASVLACCSPGYSNLQLDTNGIFHYQDPSMGGQYTNTCTPDEGKNLVSNGMSSTVRIRPLTDTSGLNSSPQFIDQDTILFVAKDSLFTNHVSAIDPDGDSLAYHFSRPYTFNLNWICGISGPCSYSMITKTPMPQLFFATGYSIAQPAGAGLTLDPQTGWLKGSIHDTGTYQVPVSVMEYRKGLFLDSVTKDVSIRVFDPATLPKPKAVLPSLINNCHDFTVTLPNNSTPDYHGYNWLRTFRWTLGDGDTSTAVNPVHTYADTGAYKVRMIIFPGLYCTDTAYSTVLVYPKVDAAFSHDDSCSNQPVDFINNSVSTSGPITGTNWTISLNDTIIDSATTKDLTYTFRQAPQSYSVILNITNSEGCSTSDTQTVNIYHSPYPLAFHDSVLTKGTPITLHANDGNSGLNATYNWSPPTGLSDPSSADPVLNSQTEGTWSVTITNEFGCQLTDSVHVKYYTGPDIYLPNAFSPNGDGRNDWLRPVAVGISSAFEFRVFSRGGQLLFQTKRPGEGWDGTIAQRPARPGTYVWEASGTDYKGKLIVRKGTVELIR